MNLASMKAAAMAATPGPWLLATSNSWRRFVTKFDTRSVCEPVTYSDKDRHPDLHFPNGGADGPDARLMEACSPDRILALLAVVEAAKQIDASLLNQMGAPAPFGQMRAALEALEKLP